MSLRAIHIFVIFLSILLLLFFGTWAISNFQISRNTAVLYLGIVSAAAGILLVPYLVWFIMKVRRFNKLGLAAWLLLPTKQAWACSVCFGDPHSKMSHGIFAAVCLLLGVVIFVLGGIAWTAMTWARRAKRLEKCSAGC